MYCQNCGHEIPNNLKFCPNCGESLVKKANKSSGFKASVNDGMPVGKELLNGLYEVYDYLLNIDQMLREFWNLERSYRKNRDNFDTTKISGKTQYSLITVALVFAIVGLIKGLLGGDGSGLVLGLISVALFWFGIEKSNKTFYNIGIFLLVIMAILFLQDISRSFITNFLSGLVYLFTNFIAFVVAYFITKFIIDKYNKKINNYNKDVMSNNLAIDERRKELSENINKLTSEMKNKSADWFPVDYYAIDALVDFIKIVRNHEADNVKEMVRVYKTDKYNQAIVDNSNAMNQKIDQNLNNQEQMIKLQKASNLLIMGNLVANIVNASNTGKINKNLNNINSKLRW